MNEYVPALGDRVEIISAGWTQNYTNPIHIGHVGTIVAFDAFGEFRLDPPTPRMENDNPKDRFNLWWRPKQVRPMQSSLIDMPGPKGRLP